MIAKEALSDSDKRQLLDLEGRILDIKRDLIDADAEEKESLQQDIESIRQEINSIKQSAQESIKEMFLDADKISTFSGKAYVELYKNPTRKELQEAFSNDFSALNYDDLRGFLTIDGSLYIGVLDSAEIIHDSLLKVLSNKTPITYRSGWETSNISDYLAVFVDPRYSIKPSDESYQEILDIETLHNYSASVASNKELSHMEFIYDF